MSGGKRYRSLATTHLFLYVFSALGFTVLLAVHWSSGLEHKAGTDVLSMKRGGGKLRGASYAAGGGQGWWAAGGGVATFVVPSHVQCRS